MADTKEIAKINLDNTLYDIKDNAAREAANKKLDTTTTETQTVAGNVNFNNTVKAKELFENDQRVITDIVASLIQNADIANISATIEDGKINLELSLPKSSDTVEYAKNLVGLTTSVNELNYLKGATSNIQEQINTKAPTDHASKEGIYGLGTDEMYGHIKLNDDYDFEVGDAAAGIGASQFALFGAYTELINKPKVTYLIDTMTPTATTDLFTSDSFENYDFFIIQTPSYSNKTDSVGYYFCAPTCTIISLDKLKEGSTIAFMIPRIVPSVTVPDIITKFSIKYINENTINYSPATSITSFPITIIGIKL